MLFKVVIIALVAVSTASAGHFRSGVKGGMLFQQSMNRPVLAAPTKGASYATYMPAVQAPLAAPVAAPIQAPEPAFYEQPAQRTAFAAKGSFVAASSAPAFAAPAAPLQQSSISLSQSTVAEPALMTQSVSSSSVKGGYSATAQQSSGASVQTTVEESAPVAAAAPVKGASAAASSSGYTQTAQSSAAVEAPVAHETFYAKGSAPSYVQSSATLVQSAAPVSQSSAPIAQSSATMVEAAPSVQQVDAAPALAAAPIKGVVVSDSSLAQSTQHVAVVASEQKSA